MGISLKDIFKNDEEILVENRRKTAIRNMIIFSVVIAFLIILAVVIKFWGNVDEERRIAVTRDAQNIKTAVLARATQHISDPSLGEYPGKSLEDSPATITINGIKEEYRYGYYLLTANDLKLLDVSLNLPEETYIVNYQTGDVVNKNGIKYNKRFYYSVDDLLAIEQGEVPISDSVIIISNVNDMEKIRQKPNGYFKLSADIDMSNYSAGEGWVPIPEFSGILDGRGYTISNLTVRRPTQNNVGLFGDIKGAAKITNVSLENVDITGARYTGALAGNCAGTISYVHVDGEITGYDSSTGGLVGAFSNAQINNCTIDVDVDGDAAVGGAIGTLYSGTVNRVRAKGNVTAGENGGGLVGLARISTTTYIKECAAYEAVNGMSNLGGFIGGIEMTADEDLDISNSYAIGSVQTGTKNIGGMFGQVYTVQGTPNLIFRNLYADVSVVVKGETSGGFIGQVSVGNSTGKTIENCFWKKDIAAGEVLNDVGEALQGSAMSFAYKEASDMLMKSSYTDWNFETVWDMKERVNTPTLKWEKDYPLVEEIADEK